MTRRVRWGIISTANIGRRRVAPALKRARNAEVLALGSGSQRTGEYAAELGIPRVYGSYDEVLQDGDIDAVYVPLPNHMHAEWTKRTADAGKHVLCEKPLALDAGEAREMIEYCADRGVLLMEAFMYRFHPQHARVQELIGEGAVGTPELFRASFTFHVSSDDNIRLVKEYGGGSLYDVGCYCVNGARFVMGAGPVEVLGEADWSTRFGVDMRFYGVVQLADGSAAVFDAGLRSGHAHRYEIVGSEGSVMVPEAFVPTPGEPTEVILRNTEGEQHFGIEAVDQYQLMVEHFGDCILQGSMPRYTPQDTLGNMRAIEALYASARERRWVRL